LTLAFRNASLRAKRIALLRAFGSDGANTEVPSGRPGVDCGVGAVGGYLVVDLWGADPPARVEGTPGSERPAERLEVPCLLVVFLVVFSGMEIL
jgi:hypothetical protein